MPAHQPRIIVIEDHPLVRAGQRMLLEVAGYRVAEITNSADLADFTSTFGTDQAIIADFDLGPGLSGLEVALEIMRRAGTRIPTLLLSASFGERTAAAVVGHDVTVMFKPASEEAVLAWVAGAVDQRRPGTKSTENSQP